MQPPSNRRLISLFEKQYPEPNTELVFENDFQLLICVILSAQCTDKKVNIVSKELFKKYPTPNSMDTASEQDIAQIIK
ncbi:MAG: hypothetical protein KDD53_02910, partial [Bdellovibrionales bacterium]|nr:hypothetical protein [Bdellovibrionales bacterium]